MAFQPCPERFTPFFYRLHWTPEISWQFVRVEWKPSALHRGDDYAPTTSQRISEFHRAVWANGR